MRSRRPPHYRAQLWHKDIAQPMHEELLQGSPVGTSVGHEPCRFEALVGSVHFRHAHAEMLRPFQVRISGRGFYDGTKGNEDILRFEVHGIIFYVRDLRI